MQVNIGNLEPMIGHQDNQIILIELTVNINRPNQL